MCPPKLTLEAMDVVFGPHDRPDRPQRCRKSDAWPCPRHASAQTHLRRTPRPRRRATRGVRHVTIRDEEIRQQLRLGEDSRWGVQADRVPWRCPFEPRAGRISQTSFSPSPTRTVAVLLCGVSDDGRVQDMSRERMAALDRLLVRDQYRHHRTDPAHRRTPSGTRRPGFPSGRGSAGRSGSRAIRPSVHPGGPRPSGAWMATSG